MKFAGISKHKHFRPVMGAVIAVLCGLALWQMPLGEPWVNASYDYLFRFNARGVTNKVLLVEMDNTSYDKLIQQRGAWDRMLHARLLDKLTEAGCPLVVFDVWFEKERDENTDAILAKAMQRNGHVLLMAKVGDPQHPGSKIAETVFPLQRFHLAATNTGIAKLDAAVGALVRRHWPFPAPEDVFTSLPWTAARLSGANLPEEPVEQWVRYYASGKAWETVSFHFALQQPAKFFQGRVVFIGNKPAQADSSIIEDDKFLTPYSRWTDDAVGGVEVLITEYLNLMNGDWLRRLPGWLEVFLLCVSGAIIGGGLGLVRPLRASILAVGAFVLITLGAVSWSYFSNFWFPWLVIVGGQIPCALAWAIGSRGLQPVAVEAPVRKSTVVLSPDMFGEVSEYPEAPDYEFFGAAFGEGAFGKVWVVRNSIGQYQALKAIYEAKFGKNTKPYEMEFKGIKRFKPISSEHPGLLRVDFVSRQKPEGYFYYVMELGDAAEPSWEQDPSKYRPRDLYSAALQRPDGRLSVADCVRIGASLAEALDFLHRQGFVHRDIKPTNIIFVKGRPKLADVGLVTDIRPDDQVTSFAGTEHYMPPPPETPGTPQADIYALGKVLYVTSTGNHPRQFPELPPNLLANAERAAQFMHLNAVLLKACDPDRARRYSTAAEIQHALAEIQKDWAVKGGTERW